MLSRYLPVAAVWLVVVGSELLMPVDGFWTTDNAVRFVQVQSFARNGVADPAVPWPGAEVDPSLAFAPFIPPVGHLVDGEILVGFVPFYPMLASSAYVALGVPGIRLLGLAFLLVLLLGVRALADAISPPGRIRRVAPTLAVVVAALATPIWFYALTFWEHVPASALITWACVLALRAQRTGSLSAAAGAAALAGASIYFRDVLLLMVPVALALLALGARRKRVAAVFAIGVAVVLVPLCAFNLHHYDALLGLHSQPDSALTVGWSAHLADRGGVIWALLFALHESPLVSFVLAGPLIVLMARRPSLTRKRLRLALPVLVAALSLITMLVGWGLAASASPLRALMEANGVFAGAPLLAVAFVARRSSAPSRYAAAERGLWIASVVYIAAYVLLAPARLSTGLHWGCRYLLEVAPILAVLAAVMLARLWVTGPRWPARALVAGSLAVSVALQLYSLDLQRHRRRFSSEINEVVARSPARAVLTDSWFVPQALAHVFFDKPIFLRTDGDATVLRRSLSEHGYDRVLFVAPPPPDAESRGIRVVRDGLGFAELGFGVMRTDG